MSLEMEELRQNTSRLGSVSAELRLPNAPVQQPLLVAELLTKEVIAALGEKGILGKTGILSKRGRLTDLDYDFVEAYRTVNSTPGFVIYGRTEKNSDPVHIASVKLSQQNLAVAAVIPERFMTEESVPSKLGLRLEVPVSSPLIPSVADKTRDPKNPYKSVNNLLMALSGRRGVESRVLLPEKFYTQFDEQFRGDQFSEPVRRRLRESDGFSFDREGRYVVAVTRTPDGKTRFNYGHVQRVSDEGQFAGLTMTDVNSSMTSIGIVAADVLAVYGKGLEPIYTATKK